MSWFVIDDQAFQNHKHQALMRRGLMGDADALAAGYLWMMMGSRLKAALVDGVLDRWDLFQIAPDPRVLRWADILVEVGLWHDSAHLCDRCPDPGPGRWAFHDWRRYHKPGAIDRNRLALQAERKDASLKAQVWERDALTPGAHGVPEGETGARCAYCARLVLKSTRAGRDDSPEIEHVVPRAMGIDNLVVSCRACNRRKGERSAAEAGMRPRLTDAHERALAIRDSSRPQGHAGLREMMLGVAPLPALDYTAASTGDAALGSHAGLPAGTPVTGSEPQAGLPDRTMDLPGVSRPEGHAEMGTDHGQAGQQAGAGPGTGSPGGMAPGAGQDAQAGLSAWAPAVPGVSRPEGHAEMGTAEGSHTSRYAEPHTGAAASGSHAMASAGPVFPPTQQGGGSSVPADGTPSRAPSRDTPTALSPVERPEPPDCTPVAVEPCSPVDVAPAGRDAVIGADASAPAAGAPGAARGALAAPGEPSPSIACARTRAQPRGRAHAGPRAGALPRACALAGQGRAGGGKEGHGGAGQGPAGAGPGIAEPPPTPAKPRRKRRRGRRSSSPGCLIHGDSLPCRACQFENQNPEETIR